MVRANEKIMSIFSTDSRVSKTNSVDTDKDWSPSIVINRTIVSKYANKQTLIFISLFIFNHRHSYLRSDNNELNNSRHMAMKMVTMWMIRIWWYDARKNNNHGDNDNDDTNYVGDTEVFLFLQPLMAAISSYLSGVVGHTQYAIARIHVRI